MQKAINQDRRRRFDSTHPKSRLRNEYMMNGNEVDILIMFQLFKCYTVPKEATRLHKVSLIAPCRTM